MSSESAGDSRFARALPRAIIFDIGGVIVRVDVSRALEVGGSSGDAGGKSAQQIWSALEADPRWNDWQEGKIEPRDWHRYVTQKLGSTLDFEAFSDAWCRVLEPTPMIGDELFRELTSRCSLALLSNTDPIHVACMERNFSFMQFFPTRIYSCRVGARKPAAEIYRRALAELGIAAGEALYIDDIAEFVAAARNVGLSSVQFTGVDALKKVLRGMGLLPS